MVRVGQNGSQTTARKRRLTSNQETKMAGFAKTDIRMATWARREPPMIDCHLVQRDQSLAPMKRANQNLVHKTPPYSLLGDDFLGPTLWTRLRTSPGSANPNKALHCLILRLIGISSSAEPKKTFHNVIRQPRRVEWNAHEWTMMTSLY